MTEKGESPLLVFGDDGKPSSDRAWRWITAHPWPGWTVDVVTADTDASHIEWGTPTRPTPWTPPWERDSTNFDGVPIRFLTAASDPRALLADAGADLMVVGIKPARQLSAALTGSTTEWLLAHPPSPLAIVRRTDPVARVLVCVDGSPHASRALEAFASLPLASLAAVTVLAVDDGRTDTSATDDATRSLDGRVAEVTASRTSGTPTEEILGAIETSRADLVVLGTRGLTGWKRLRLGSTASAVVRSTTSDSLVACVDSDAS
ncbi:MAG: universal stress protein [Acidimicrobiia bacterium]